MNWFKKLAQSIREQKTLEDRFFAVVVMVGLAIVLVSMVVTFIEDISSAASVGTSLGGVMLLAVIYVAYVKKQMDAARIMICYTFNCIVIPIAFFTCGGIDSGMPLYMLAGIFTMVPVLRGKHRVICIIVAVLVDVLCICISYFLTPAVGGIGLLKPDLLAQLSLESRFIDMISSLILIALYIIITTAMIMDAYQKERASREALLVKLDDLSKRDELTGLFNRRELFHFLENLEISNKEYYLCMLDIDHFKNVNDTYGHVFGDMVLRKLAEIMTEEIHGESGELVARYGGEEFLLVLKASQKQQAMDRLNQMRRRFTDTNWEKEPELMTSFSCGMVCCANYKTYAEAISQADKLLYKAKENGRNRLET
jgi:diguanylate cyclase (GGDEF)-like protein